MEEIEKLEEFNWVSGRDAITIALCNTIIRKQNEIIDHLNSQDQEEEGKQPEGGFRDWCIQKAKLGRFKGMSIPEPQSTPEQKEDWEEEFMEVLETFKDEICSNFFASSKPLTDFIQQLLEEREREVEKNLFKRLYSARSKKEFREMLSKLTTK